MNYPYELYAHVKLFSKSSKYDISILKIDSNCAILQQLFINLSNINPIYPTQICVRVSYMIWQLICNPFISISPSCSIISENRGLSENIFLRSMTKIVIVPRQKMSINCKFLSPSLNESRTPVQDKCRGNIGRSPAAVSPEYIGTRYDRQS